MTENEPDAIYYSQRAAEDVEDDLRVTLYYLAREFAVGGEFGCADYQGGWQGYRGSTPTWPLTVGESGFVLASRTA